LCMCIHKRLSVMKIPIPCKCANENPYFQSTIFLTAYSEEKHLMHLRFEEACFLLSPLNVLMRFCTRSRDVSSLFRACLKQYVYICTTYKFGLTNKTTMTSFIVHFLKRILKEQSCLHVYFVVCA
jgi:hypothetical protein